MLHKKAKNYFDMICKYFLLMLRWQREVVTGTVLNKRRYSWN
jgi:hypothetical protein